ncbi:MAG: hypothetical protein AB7R55_18685 [Gemmatimonadales bacterium]
MADDPEVPEEGPDPDADGSPKRDLRYSESERGNVRVNRQLDGSGHLARGDKTRMSVLSFSARAKPREERDPEFEFRPAKPKAAPAGQAAAAAAAAPELPPAPAVDAEQAQPAPSAEAPGEGSLLGKIKTILGL